MEILQGRAIPYMLHGDEGCAVLIVSFQGVDGWKKDADLSMDELLNSNKKNGFPPEGRVVQLGLRSIKFFRLLWETLAAPVSGPTSCAWVEHAGIFEQSYLHFAFQLLEYASSIVMYCVHVPVQLLGWNAAQIAQLASMKNGAFGM